MKRIYFNDQIKFVLTGLNKEQMREAKDILQTKGMTIDKTVKKNVAHYIVYDPSAPENQIVLTEREQGGYALVPYTDFLANANAVTDENGFVCYNDFLLGYVGKDSVISVPSGIREICEEAFLNNNTITEISLSNTVRIIGNSAFYGCVNLQKVDLPLELEEMGSNVFCDCKSIAQVTVPDSLVKAGAGSFIDCRSLKTINVPSCIIDDESLTGFIFGFNGAITVSPNNKEYISKDGGVYNSGITTVFYHESIDTCAFPATVTTINDSFFGTNIWPNPIYKELVLPEGLVDITRNGLSALFSLSLDKLVCSEILVEKYYNDLCLDTRWNKSKLIELGLRLIRKGIAVYDDKAEGITKELFKKYREDILGLIIKSEDTKALAEYLNRLNKVTIEKVDEIIDAVGENAELKAVLLEYKNTRFSDTELKKPDEFELDINPNELSLADGKKQFVLKYVEENGIRIEKYKGNEDAVFVPQVIGKRSVVGINLPRFLETPVKLVLPASMVIPRSKVNQRDIMPGVIVELGQYYGSGNTIEPLKWRVLSVQANEALLITDRIIEYMPYHHKREGVFWDTSDMRKWLNSTFFGFAFTEEERQLVLEKEHSTTSCAWGYSYAGSVITTKDKVFLLSKDESEQYLQTEEDRVAFPTQRYSEVFKENLYHVEKGSEDPVYWALRSDAKTGNAGIYVVSPEGKVICGRMVSLVDDMHGIRPAIWIRTSN